MFHAFYFSTLLGYNPWIFAPTICREQNIHLHWWYTNRCQSIPIAGNIQWEGFVSTALFKKFVLFCNWYICGVFLHLFLFFHFKVSKKYKDIRSTSLPPHIYQVARSAHLAVLHKKKNQVIKAADIMDIIRVQNNVLPLVYFMDYKSCLMF